MNVVKYIDTSIDNYNGLISEFGKLSTEMNKRLLNLEERVDVGTNYLMGEFVKVVGVDQPVPVKKPSTKKTVKKETVSKTVPVKEPKKESIPKIEEKKVEEPIKESVKESVPKIEEKKVEEPIKESAPKIEEKKVEEPIKESAPKIEEKKVEEPIKESVPKEEPIKESIPKKKFDKLVDFFIYDYPLNPLLYKGFVPAKVSLSLAPEDLYKKIAVKSNPKLNEFAAFAKQRKDDYNNN